MTWNGWTAHHPKKAKTHELSDPAVQCLALSCQCLSVCKCIHADQETTVSHTREFMHRLYKYMLVTIGWWCTVPPSRAVAYRNQLVWMQSIGPLRGEWKTRPTTHRPRTCGWHVIRHSRKAISRPLMCGHGRCTQTLPCTNERGAHPT